MIISSTLSTGQLTFIIRVAIQILSFGGLFIVGILILSNAPRVSPAVTHDVVNRVVGKSTATISSLKWILGQFRGRERDSNPSTSLLVALLLSVSYSAFVAVSDIGFIGLYACSTPGPSIMDLPASVNSNDAARALLSANLLNNTDPNSVGAYRCDVSEVFQLDGTPMNRCIAWKNSTYGDEMFFARINSTDTDVLMPRRLAHNSFNKIGTIDRNTFYLGPGTQRVSEPVIRNGLAVAPHRYGLRVVLGVPQLAPEHKTVLPKTMALEVDVGCMTIGIDSQHSVDAAGFGVDAFATNGSWRVYSGPDYLRDVLAQAADDIRDAFLPSFNQSTLNANGLIAGINQSTISFSSAAHITDFSISQLGSQTSHGPEVTIIGNCTERLQRQLGLSQPRNSDPGSMCGLLAYGGSISNNSTLLQYMSRLVCASATQINMVSATVERDLHDRVSVDITRLPGELNYLRADYWGESALGVLTFDPLERFTLTDNPGSATSHFIPHSRGSLSDARSGVGSGANAFARVGDVIMDVVGLKLFGSEFAGLLALDEGLNEFNASVGSVTAWAGQLGASYIINSVAYNGWAALHSEAVEVASTGGVEAACYKSVYALAFLPLLLAALLMVLWILVLFITSALSGVQGLRARYGGMGPYIDVVYPQAPLTMPILAWEQAPRPHLEAVDKGQVMDSDSTETALSYLKSRRGYSA